jgi:hypothetical protein
MDMIEALRNIGIGIVLGLLIGLIVGIGSALAAFRFIKPSS